MTPAALVKKKSKVNVYELNKRKAGTDEGVTCEKEQRKVCMLFSGKPDSVRPAGISQLEHLRHLGLWKGLAQAVLPACRGSKLHTGPKNLCPLRPWDPKPASACGLTVR